VIASGSRRPTLGRVLDEPVVMLLWPRAALMQLAHPWISPTEVESGSYGHRGWHRWEATMMWMRMAAEADPESMAMYVREVNRVHAAVRVPDDEIHARRPTFDPGNQLWVAATWFQSMIDTYSLLVCEIDDDVRDDLLAEFAKVATFLQVREESWPADMQAFKAYRAREQARFPDRLPRSDAGTAPEHPLPGDMAHQVFSTYSLPRRMVRKASRTRLLTWGMAGDALRRTYDIEWSDDHQARFLATARRMKRRTALIPGRIRRRNGRKERRRIAARLQEIQYRSYTDIKAREIRAARAHETVE